jgi:hypothetical protein
MSRSTRRSTPTSSSKKCLFCGRVRRLTKEHINPRWLQQYVGRRFTNTGHSVSVRNFDASTGGLAPYRFDRGKLHRAGDPHSSTLKILCAECNNVHMSALQERAKVHLLPLVLGEWPELGPDGQSLVAAWSAMNTMVREAAHPPTVATSAEERLEFLTTVEAPQTWSVWIGRYSGTQSGVMNHVGWNESMDASPSASSIKGVHRQTTGFVMGKLFILTFSTRDNVGDARRSFGEAFAHQYDLRLIWPTQPHVIPAQTVYDWRGWNLVAREIPRRRAGIEVRMLGDPGLQGGS